MLDPVLQAVDPVAFKQHGILGVVCVLYVEVVFETDILVPSQVTDRIFPSKRIHLVYRQGNLGKDYAYAFRKGVLAMVKIEVKIYLTAKICCIIDT